MANHNKTSKKTSRNLERLAFAIEQLEKHDIEYSIKNEATGHIHCRRKSDDTFFQFWAGTGKIMNRNERGIHNLIKLLNDVQ